MFDELMQHPLVLALPHVLAVVYGFVLSRVIELVPSFAKWWDKQPANYKLAYRGWAGLILSVIVVAFTYGAGLAEFQAQTVADWLILVAAVVISWLLYVGSAEGTYQATKDRLMRKQPNWSPH
jgi:hypothetical protein